jgi:iron complex transport system ATP-binding protein
LFHRKSLEDEDNIAQALEAVGLGGFSSNLFHQLSGGEQQRGLIARALVQKSKFLVLDEPINHLDVFYQHQILQLLRQLAHEQGITVVLSLHDLNLAKDYCDTLCLLSEGKTFGVGKPESVLQPDYLKRIFKLPCHLLDHPQSDSPLVFFKPKSVAENNS